MKTISEFMGVEPIRINSSLVSPALRDRYYWTNIDVPPFDFINDKEIELNDILTEGWSDKKKAKCLLVSDSRPSTTPIRMVNRYLGLGFTTLIFKDEDHYKECVAEWNRLKGDEKKIPVDVMKEYTGHVFDGVRYMNQKELEICQTVPDGYTKCLTRNEAADVLGDGWTIDIISNIFKYAR